MYKHVIKLKPDANIVNMKQYRISFAQRDELKKTIEMREKNGIIRKSISRFNSPFFWYLKNQTALKIRKKEQ